MVARFVCEAQKQTFKPAMHKRQSLECSSLKRANTRVYIDLNTPVGVNEASQKQNSFKQKTQKRMYCIDANKA